MSANAAENCRPPDYRAGFILEDTPSSIWMNISIRMNDFAPARLVCLARTLKQRYSDRKEIKVLMFSSFAAARGFTAPLSRDSVAQPPADWYVHNHAIYSFNADKREELVDLLPVGFSGEFRTTIDLPITKLPPCTLEVAGRCLLAVERPTYPGAARRTKVSGGLTLEGVIAGNGKVKRIKAVGVPTLTSGNQDMLLQAALRNLKTWRFEPAHRQDPIRITYDYRVDPSTPSRGTPTVHFDLPNRVEIRVRPIP